MPPHTLAGVSASWKFGTWRLGMRAIAVRVRGSFEKS
jgi:hypothetical protein